MERGEQNNSPQRASLAPNIVILREGKSTQLLRHDLLCEPRRTLNIDLPGLQGNWFGESARGGRRRTNVLLPPECDVQQCPTSFLQERRDSLKLKKVCAFAKVFCLLRKILSEFGVIPFVNWHAKALLLPVNKLVWYHSPHGLLQNGLEYSVSGLYGLGDTHGQLHELVVEKWNARFQTHCHAHFVHAHEQKFRQSQIQIQISHPIERRWLPGLFLEALPNGPECFPRTKIGEFLAQSRRKELLLLRVAEYL